MVFPYLRPGHLDQRIFNKSEFEILDITINKAYEQFTKNNSDFQN